jgi:amino acid transporter
MAITTAGPPQAPATARPVSLPLLVGFTVAATGGPLALASLYVPGAVSSLKSIGLVALLAAGLFAVPLTVWYRYSEHVVSAGGLFSFVEASAGRPIALCQAGVWTISYALYLPYTIVYIVYDLLPVVIPGVAPYKPVLVIALPLGIAGLGLMGVRAAMRVVAVIAIGQLALLALLVIVGIAHVGAPVGTFRAHGHVEHLFKDTADVSLLYVCASLPLYMGGELRGGSRTMRSGLVIGVGAVAAAVLIGVLPWAAAGQSTLAAPIPGVALAESAWGHGFGVLIGLGVAASVVGVVIAEYFALTRLLHAVSGRALSRTTGIVAGFFVVASAVALVNPTAFYDDLLKPSLVALWISQLFVFLVYPRFAAMHRRPLGGAVALALGASALMGYGLYSAITLVSGT